MTARFPLLVGLLLLTPSLLGAATTLDFPGGPITFGNVPEISVVAGEPLSLRLNQAGDLVLRRGDTEQRIAELARTGGQISLPVMYTDAAGIHVFWRVKLTVPTPGLGNPGDKLVYVRSSTDGGKTFGPPHRLNRDGGAFDPRVAGNGRGAAYATWLDERFGMYHLYLNRTTDAGKTWQMTETKIDIRPDKGGGTFDPAILAAGDQVWVVWVEGNIAGRTSSIKASRRHARRLSDFDIIPVHEPGAPKVPSEPFVLMLRRSADRGQTWSDPIRVVEPGAQPFSLTFLRAKDSLLLYWFTQEGFAGVRSTDDGRTWTPVTGLPKMQDVGLAGLSGGVDPRSGRVILAHAVDRETGRPALMVTSSADGMQFDAPAPLATKTPHLTSALMPQVVPSKDGTVMIVWQDLRYIRSSVCARFSKDGGRTWLERDTCIDEPPGKFHAFFPKGAADGAGGFFAVWVRSMDDRMERSEVVVTRVDPRRPPTPTGLDAATQARLEERVAAFWTTRIAGDWAASFSFMDPIFRSRVTREAYIGTQGVVKYHEFELRKVAVTERIAQATVSYTYEVPRIEVAPGRVQSVPKRADPTTQEWIFVDGDWYLVFKDLMNQPFFRY